LPDQPVAPEVEAAGVPGAAPAMHGEDPDGDPGERRREAAEDASFGAVRVDDLRPDASANSIELEETEKIAPRVDLAADLAKRDEAGAARRDWLPQRPVPMRGDGHLARVRESAHQLGDVGLRASRLREGDDD